MFDNAKNENENEINFSSSRFYRFRNFRSTIFEFVKNDDVFQFDVQMKKKKYVNENFFDFSTIEN